MKNWRVRLAVSVAVAFALPTLNVHVDTYVPLITALLEDPNWKTLEFWWVAGLYVGIYTGVVFAILSLVTLLARVIVHISNHNRKGA